MSAETAGAQRIRLVVAATNLPFLVLLVLMGGASVGLALLLCVAVAVIWAEPPVRTRDRPMLDLVSGAALVTLPAVAGFLVGGLDPVAIPWIAVAAFAAWSAAACAMWTLMEAPGARAAGRESTATALGPTATAAVAVVGFLLAAALAATSGRSGALAALGLDLYLLLPAMVLLARGADRAARRAWSDFGGLNELVGAWLLLVWSRYTLFRDVDAWQIAGLIAAVAVGAALVNVTATRIASRRRGTRSVDPDDIPALTIIVPTRNDAGRLPDVLAALLDQTYADASVLVVDDDSEDDTAVTAASWLGDEGRVVVAPPRPEGWSSRAWASQAGADASMTDLLLFVDPATILVPVAVRHLVEQLQARRLDLASGLGRLDMPTRGERATVPGHPLRTLGFRPIWLGDVAGGRLRRATYATETPLLVRRDAYQAAGGHGAHPHGDDNGLELARAVVANGGRVGTVQATDLVSTHPFTDGRDAISAWRRVFLPSVGGSLAGAIAMLLLETMAWIVPLALPVLAWISGADARHLAASFAPLSLLVALRIALIVTGRHPPGTLLWHPVTAVLTIAGQVMALGDHVMGRMSGWSSVPAIGDHARPTMTDPALEARAVGPVEDPDDPTT